ncbi:S8 family serine peptidase [Peribacillus sp. B-H-3]|uniref:S8 family peptidase n=1 Tax=Peribacillus sp. B-H-3 TaxID=3400420 RepID=UPI003B02A074
MLHKKASCIPAFLIIFIMFFGFTLPVSSLAEAMPNASIENQSILLGEGADVSGLFEKPAVKWYKISPSKDDSEKFSHAKILVKSEKTLNVSVYPSLEKAAQDSTFDLYRGAAGKDAPAEIHFPYAWANPYYVKVEYLGAAESEVPALDSSENEGDGTAEFSISYKPENLAPSEQPAQPECPVELSSSQEKSGGSLLAAIRLFRDGTLAKTEEGRKLSSLYYKASPFLAAKLIVSKDKRNEVYENLIILKPIIDDLNKNGADSTHVISKNEQKSIQNLYDSTYEAAPESLEKQMDEAAQKVDISGLAGERITDVMKDGDISLPEAAISGKYIIKLKDGKKLTDIKSTSGYAAQSVVSSINSSDRLFGNMYELNIKDTAAQNGLQASSASALTASQLEKLPEVEFVEPVQKFRALSADVQFPYQWSLQNKGLNEGKAHADIHYDYLQNLIHHRTLKDTVIAVVDSGTDSSLADLREHVRTDLGKNMIDHSTNTMDDNGHGTHVSGIIAASQDNGFSMSGINPKAQIMPVKVLDASGQGDTENVAYGIIYAVDHGAKAINLSLGGKYSRVLEYALKYAYSKNVPVIVASGNDGLPQLSYPASSRYVISVGATNRLDLVSDYSNYGDGLDLVAPGSGIPSLLPDGNVTYMDGTSMAAPHVTATVGLLLAENPSLKISEIEKILHETSDHVAFVEKDNQDSMDYSEDGEEPPAKPNPAGWDFVTGYGRLNAFSALSDLDLHAKIKIIKDNENHLTGTAAKNSLIEVRNGTKLLGKSAASANGSFTVNVPVQKANQQLSVTISSQDHAAKTTLKVYVQKGAAPSVPTVASVTDKSSYIAGKAQPGLAVKAINTSKRLIGQAVSDSKGSYKIKIARQKAYSALYIHTTDLAKRNSKSAKVIVKDKTAPSAPKASIKGNKITGRAEPFSTVKAVNKGKAAGTARAGKKGQFTISMSKKATGFIYLYARDKAGNVSKPAKILVKK